MHEHLFVRNPELEADLPAVAMDESTMIDDASVALLSRLFDLGIRTIVDLTVPGLGRDVRRVAAVADRVSVRVIASTGYYTATVLPLFFQFHGPGKLIDGPDDLVELFVRDIEEGIAGTSIRAGMLKVVTDAPAITPDVARVLTAAAEAHQQTGVPITTHSHPASGSGLAQQAFLRERGVALERVIIGHAGDTDDLDHLRSLMDAGSTIGMDRFGMEHVLPDERRVATVLGLLRLGYADRMVLSHDAACFSHVTPPAWRQRHAPNWHMERISRTILPMLRDGGCHTEQIEQMMVANPAKLLSPTVDER